MLCPTAKVLFENYANAAREQFEAADALATLVGSMGSLRKPRNMLNRRTRNAVPPTWHWRSTGWNIAVVRV